MNISKQMHELSDCMILRNSLKNYCTTVFQNIAVIEAWFFLWSSKFHLAVVLKLVKCYFLQSSSVCHNVLWVLDQVRYWKLSRGGPGLFLGGSLKENHKAWLRNGGVHWVLNIGGKALYKYRTLTPLIIHTCPWFNIVIIPNVISIDSSSVLLINTYYLIWIIVSVFILVPTVININHLNVTSMSPQYTLNQWFSTVGWGLKVGEDHFSAFISRFSCWKSIETCKYIENDCFQVVFNDFFFIYLFSRLLDLFNVH